MSAAEAAPIPQAEANALFADLAHCKALVLAVSGGPDSTALLVMAARWRDRLKHPPKLLAVTIDHGLRPEARREASAVKRLAQQLRVEHRTLRWTGRKPTTGLQEAARAMRYRRLADVATAIGASHILTAHTLDDQAETVLIRLARGSGITGLGAMARTSLLGARTLTRPLLDIPKARLVATLQAADIPFAQDPSNRDPRFTRVRMREAMPVLAHEGLDARRLALLARRIRRADAAIEVAVGMAEAAVATVWGGRGAIRLDADRLSQQPAEVRLRLLGRAIALKGDEGPVELGKLEALAAALEPNLSGKKPKGVRFRRTLAGALVTLIGGEVTVDRAPPRRARVRGAGGA